MERLKLLQSEIAMTPPGVDVTSYYMAQGFSEHWDDPVPVARAHALETLFTGHRKYIYPQDLILGSSRGRLSDDPFFTGNVLERAKSIVSSYGSNTFLTNKDHYAPDYETFLADGVSGTLQKIHASLSAHQCDQDAEKKQVFLRAAEISIRAFGQMILQYGEAAEAEASRTLDAEQRENFLTMARICRKLSRGRPNSFREALQLVWLAHTAFLYEGRYAMALGRLDQLLFPYYERDCASGSLTKAGARELLECTLCKIGEARWFGGDDVVNIAIAGRRPDGEGALNELSYCILEAVRNCNIPGPNLSARLYNGIPDQFLDECLKVIGTGLGYPALMNDEVNIPALRHHGYAPEDCNNYCMVGCIENFLPGRQPPWSDGRYNSPKFIELALNNGRCMLTGVQLGPETGDAAELTTMDIFMEALVRQMEFGAAEYMARFRNENERYSHVAYSQPFLSCFCRLCIERGLDIGDGGAMYPSVHGAGCMGIATFADSLAALEEVVFRQKTVTLPVLRDALRTDFSGCEKLRAALLRAPKYGNDDDAADKYAVFYVELHHRLFSRYRTWDGGAIYTAIASNVSNIPAGREVAATPDGRHSRQPLSDAASPSHGMDKSGPTAVVQSISKPDYTKVSCGTVLNQKFSPSMFIDPRSRGKLLSLIKVYFQRGGQEIQINSVSRSLLKDAMEHPEEYGSLVVRVSGFSAYYTGLDGSVQRDILERTEHE